MGAATRQSRIQRRRAINTLSKSFAFVADSLQVIHLVAKTLVWLNLLSVVHVNSVYFAFVVVRAHLIAEHADLAAQPTLHVPSVVDGSVVDHLPVAVMNCELRSEPPVERLVGCFLILSAQIRQQVDAIQFPVGFGFDSRRGQGGG